jgi:hypothetical protein
MSFLDRTFQLSYFFLFGYIRIFFGQGSLGKPYLQFNFFSLSVFLPVTFSKLAMFGWFGLVGYVCGYFRLDLLLSLLLRRAAVFLFERTSLSLWVIWLFPSFCGLVPRMILVGGACFEGFHSEGLSTGYVFPTCRCFSPIYSSVYRCLHGLIPLRRPRRSWLAAFVSIQIVFPFASEL